MICPLCKGTGGERVPVLYNGIGGGPWEDCPTCEGRGIVSFWLFLRVKFWQYAPQWYIEWYVARQRRQVTDGPA